MKLLFCGICIVLTAPLLAQSEKDIDAAKAKYLQEVPVNAEVARYHYVHALVKINDKLMLFAKTPQWTKAVDAVSRAIDHEMKQHPAPANSDSRTLSKLRVGRWHFRHDYIFSSDGTYRMGLP